jgi:hypothetical protein
MSKKVKTSLPKEVVTPKSLGVTEKRGISFFKNFILLIASIGLVLMLFKGNAGYSWVWTDLIQENLKFISRNSHLTEAQKYQAKFGVDAAAIDLIKKNTPDDAVILFPPFNVIMNDSSDYKFQKGLGGIKIRNWTLYFLYPRKLVYAEELETSPFASQVNYVVCMNGWGYDKISYEPVQKTSFQVLPIAKQSSPTFP